MVYDAPSKKKPETPQSASIYQESLRDLRYLADPTRLDIAFATAVSVHAIQKPTIRHWKLFKAAIQYIKTTAKH